MKRVTASEARRRWFQLLDEVARGQVVVVERHGRRIVIQKQPVGSTSGAAPDYSAVLRVPRPEDADRWGWSWHETGALRSRTARRKKGAT